MKNSPPFYDMGMIQKSRRSMGYAVSYQKEDNEVPSKTSRHNKAEEQEYQPISGRLGSARKSYVRKQPLDDVYSVTANVGKKDQRNYCYLQENDRDRNQIYRNR